MSTYRACLLGSLGILVLAVCNPIACSGEPGAPAGITGSAGLGGAGSAGVAGAGGAGAGGAPVAGAGSAGKKTGGSGGKKAGASQGGSSGSSSCEPAWLCDPSLLTPTNIEGDFCHFMDIDIQKSPFPKLEWTSCGPGCLETITCPFNNCITGHSASLLHEVGENFLHLSSYLLDDPEKRQFVRYVRLSNGETVAAAMTNDKFDEVFCGALQHSREAPANIIFYSKHKESTTESRYTSGRFKGNKIEWNTKTVDGTGIADSAFDFDLGWGIQGDIGVGLVTQKDQEQFQKIPGGAGYTSDAQKDIVVFLGYKDGRNNIQRFSFKDGKTAIVDDVAGSAISALALSDQYLVWLSNDGDGSGTYEKAYISWAPFPDSGGPIAPDKIKTFPLDVVHDLLTLRTYGDFAVTSVSMKESPDTYHFLIFQFSTQKTWKFTYQPKANNWPSHIIGVGPKEAFIGLTSNPSEGTLIPRVMRIDLEQLDEFEKAWAAVP